MDRIGRGRHALECAEVAAGDIVGMRGDPLAARPLIDDGVRGEIAVARVQSVAALV